MIAHRLLLRSEWRAEAIGKQLLEQGVDVAAEYDPRRDYRGYLVDDSDGPLLTTREAARVLGHETTQGVRGLIGSGRLPSCRHNRQHLIPEWAVHGRRAWMYQSNGMQPSSPATTEAPAGRARVIELEAALMALRAAAEHEQRALKLQHKALKEMQKANDILKEAVGSVAVPATAEEIATPTR